MNAMITRKWVRCCEAIGPCGFRKLSCVPSQPVSARKATIGMILRTLTVLSPWCAGTVPRQRGEIRRPALHKHLSSLHCSDQLSYSPCLHWHPASHNPRRSSFAQGRFVTRNTPAAQRCREPATARSLPESAVTALLLAARGMIAEQGRWPLITCGRPNPLTSEAPRSG